MQTVLTAVESLAAEKELALQARVSPELPLGRGDERGGQEVFRDVKETWVIDADGAPPPKLEKGELAVWDPGGTAAARLTARGVPVMLPLRDTQEIAALTYADLWGESGEQVRRASARYQADAVTLSPFMGFDDALAN